MTCCHCEATDRHFGDSSAKGDLRRYHADGPDATTRAIIHALRRSGLREASLMDIGAGIGVIHHELLEETFATAVHVEAASSYVHYAREEAQRRGHADRVQFVYGDFIERTSDLPEVDVVTLDRVICCYPDVVTLVRDAASKARRLLVASFPRDTWYVRIAIALQNAKRLVLRDPFRTFVHSPNQVDALLTARGLSMQSVQRTFIWQIVVYERTAGSP